METEKIALPRLDYNKATEEICSFIKRIVEEAHASGAVVGLSGGVDSSVVAALCVKALGRNKVLGILMLTDFTPKEDEEDARRLAEQLGIRTEILNIQDVSNKLFGDLSSNPDDSRQKKPRANIYARLRMTILYYYANLNNHLVAGTGDRSEALIGFFTKHGDGGVDFLPIVHLYKTQVRKLALHLGVPEKISNKPSSPQLYPGHKATDEIPLDYDRLDYVLVGLFDRKFPPEEISRLTSIPIKTVEEVLSRFNASKHKRSFPPSVRER